MTETNGAANLNTKNGNFICGVVEGFYGRPWTTEQRKDLFQKLKKWGMDSYLYAPKDDYKHRAYWRDLYTVEEAEHLTGLITAAREYGITFYYALSPGLDITYSSSKEVTALKRKLEQVSQFGCTAFALLFDDIEPEMSEADKEIFQSFAHAQVSVTNDIFQHLGQPRFLLCPTQYCATRAMPNVASSEYLNTLGSKLAQEIDIMWTGPKVISRLLTVESIEEITEVLRRPPVIWDNLHANDYDQKRVFLGPYSGRSPDLIPKLRGVLTNPNCEYGANFIAIHTLAQWSRCNVDGKRDLSLNDTVSADIKLETETEDGVLGEDVPSTLSPNIQTTTMCRAYDTYSNYSLREHVYESYINDNNHSSCHAYAWDTCSEASGSMQVEVDGASPTVNGTQMIIENDSENHENSDNADAVSQPVDIEKQLTHEDLSLLCDLFYLPFEHGGQGIQLLQEFNWLKSNAYVVMKKSKEEEQASESDIEEWHLRAAKLNDMCNAVNRLFQRLTYCNNRELLYDLYAYVWDMRGVVSLLNSYVKWLAFGRFPSTMTTFTQGSYTWFSNGWKETFMSGEQEPWVFRGGLTADLQRLIPVDSGNDLFVYKAPEVPNSKIYTIRPYLPSDEEAVYTVCNQINNCTTSSAVADRLIGGFLTLSPELCMIVEDENGIAGYTVATLNVKSYNQKMAISWIPELRMKYPLDNSISELPQNVQDAIQYFHSFIPDVSEQLCRQHPSKLICGILSSVTDQSICKRLVTCVLAALRANGSFGVHTTMLATDKESHEFYGKLGFVDLNPAHEEYSGIKTMCRSF
ncbi:Bifunctional protein NCOAT [Atta colombica]|uniref:protein O-GlcNAcase n=1 Tax=Atta colombica TaxID=520822 RepID=A0A195BRD9_9HYME|nr:Bifunctional protein NCOAT [Atta colombica]